MAARLYPAVSLMALLLAACANTEQLHPGVVCQQHVSARDIDEIRAMVLSRPDIRKPLWGLTCDDRGRLVAQSGGRRPPNIGSFVTLVHRNGKWQIIKIREGPVMVVEVFSKLSGTW
jgi:hypothetical protein